MHSANEVSRAPTAVVVDRSRMMEAGLAALLRAGDIMAVESSGSLDLALDLCRASPEAVLLAGDLGPGAGMFGIPERVRRAELSNPVVLLIRMSDAAHVARLIHLGAHGLVERDEAPSRLLEALRSVVMDNEVWISPKIASALVRSGRAAADGADLTPREIEILVLLAGGLSSESIARQMGVARGTVRNQLSAIYGKLGVRTRAETMVWAWKNGYL